MAKATQAQNQGKAENVIYGDAAMFINKFSDCQNTTP
jgi:hypothetical protein